MSTPLDTVSPLNYNNWLKYQVGINPDIAVFAYTEYLQDWYKNNKSSKTSYSDEIKQNYIQLLKDLSFLFETGEQDPFISQIDYNNDEDIILAIPYFVKKLKDVCKDLTYKRETLKDSKLKYNLVGSHVGLEKVLYEYVLKNFTKGDSQTTEIPISLLSSTFPALSTVDQNFYIEVEELHDSQSYHDSDPSVSINQYVNINDVKNDIPFEGMTEDEVFSLISSRYLSRVADTPLSRVFAQYLSEIPNLSTNDLFTKAQLNITNQIEASRKYLGETVYGLTAVRLSDVYKNNPDYVLNLSFEQGNNWFFWPSGDKIINDTVYNNIYTPIEINSSNLVKSGATGGSDYTDSDLIFTNKSGIVEGAWLQGPRIDKGTATMEARIFAGDIKDFIYPFPGFNITSKGTLWGGFSFTDSNFNIYDKLLPEQKQKLLNEYFTQSLPNTSVNDIYLNNTTLVYNGAYADFFSTEADTIVKRKSTQKINPVYSDKANGNVEEAYLYKFLNTDFPITVGVNDIAWPICKFDSNPLPITILNDTCLPITLSQTNPQETLKGSIASRNFSTSDVIYKLNTKTGQPVEAAWLGSGPISNLILKNDIEVYDTPAIYCSSYIDGDVQGSLSTKIDGSKFVSFVWCDEDTYADEVFSYKNHAEDCPYLKTSPHNYYTNQDYQNTAPIDLNYKAWSKCRCKSVLYSPIGHDGKSVTDYNGMTDYLFADPQGLGEDFAFNTWIDTRGFNPLNSPQFSFFKLDGKSGDKQVGWGSGSWQSGTGSRMVLKTGKRYTYYRTSLRADDGKIGGEYSPYLIVNYKYKNLKGFYVSTGVPNDIVILIDKSHSEKDFLENTLNTIKQFLNELISNTNIQIQVSIISFAETSTIENYLTKDIISLDYSLFDIKIPSSYPSYQTDIYGALQLADYILNTTISSEAPNASLTDLCTQLNATIQRIGTFKSPKNLPNSNATKNILIFSDGYETVNTGLALPFAKSLKDKGIQISSIGIGPNTYYTNKMKLFASDGKYFNLQQYLNTGDGNINNFIQYLIASINQGQSISPFWYKAIRGSNGNWVGTNIASDLILNPGDYISYVHKNRIDYTGATSQTSFSVPAITFSANFNLDGWDYNTNAFSVTAVGNTFGAKPFWGKSYVSPESNYDQHFDKQVLSFGGQIRFIDGYVPIHQPEISSMILNNGNYIEYSRKTNSDFIWSQPLTLSISNSSYSWNQLYFKKDISNLEELLNINNVEDLIAYSTTIPSQILLEGYTGFLPDRYNYYSRNAFNYTEDLFYQNKCLNSFVIFNTAVAIKADNVYANLDNIHYPTLASVSFPSLAVTEKQTGGYLLPENLGTSYYRGRGYSIEVSKNKLSYIDSISAERMFLDTNKYGSRNRGLTKKDQNSPVEITSIDNTWMFNPYTEGSAAGIIKDPLTNQKFTPYQSSYEITRMNNLGLSRQSDNFEFWTNINGSSYWNDTTNYPLTLRKELLQQSYEDRQIGLLTDKGSMLNWKMDIFGNNYGLFKPTDIDKNIPLP
jgi:hypothetical protein